MTVDKTSDTDLMIAVREGDLSALEALFDRYNGKLFGFFLRLTGSRDKSEDLVQEVFLRILKYRATFRADASFVVWMYRIGRNAVTDQARKSRAQIEPLEAAGEGPATTGSILDDLSLGEEVRVLREALARLPADKRELLVLARFEELRHEEIAEIVGCSAGALRVRLHRALAELREVYSSLMGEKHDVRPAQRITD
jgi:RNA polymerase sigma-70 factor (ECF subfamily)